MIYYELYARVLIFDMPCTEVLLDTYVPRYLN